MPGSLQVTITSVVRAPRLPTPLQRVTTAVPTRRSVACDLGALALRQGMSHRPEPYQPALAPSSPVLEDVLRSKLSIFLVFLA